MISQCFIEFLFKFSCLDLEEKEEFHFQMGDVYLKMEDYENAIKYFDQCLKLNPNKWINNEKIKNCINELNDFVQS
jgi:tetratricopeptide (TPR) repeat protein